MLIGTLVLLVGIVHAAGGLSHAVETTGSDRSETGLAAGGG